MQLDEAAADIVAVTPIGRYTAIAALRHVAPAGYGMQPTDGPDYSADWGDYVQPARTLVRAALAASVDMQVQVAILVARVAKLESVLQVRG